LFVCWGTVGHTGRTGNKKCTQNSVQAIQTGKRALVCDNVSLTAWGPVTSYVSISIAIPSVNYLGKKPMLMQVVGFDGLPPPFILVSC
jgi:hypothetical protein